MRHPASLSKNPATTALLARLIRRGCIGAFAALVCLTMIQVSPSVADPTYGVMNAEGGIYWRSGPDWNTPEAVAGNGFYPDTVIAVHCYQSGAANVPGSTDSMWEMASDVGGSGYGSGWVNEHFINDGQPINQPSPGVPPCGSSPAPQPPAPAPPTAPSSGSGPIYTVVDADGGVYFRNAPKWSETSATAGKGVYTGDQVQLVCGANGEAYGPFANHWWSYVQNLSRPGAGSGWVNAHFINDGMPADQPSPGEGVCPATVPGAPAAGAGATAAGPIRSVFYWPQLSVPDRPTGTPFLGVADLDIDYPAWHVDGGCNPSWPVPLFIPETVNTLAGWSKSRLAPIYFLSDFPGRRSQIENIILFDPGSYSEMQGGCDETLRPTVNSVLASWLKSNQSARLTILAGAITDETAEGAPKPTYHGLWNFYLHDIWALDSSVRSRVKICDYAGLTHPDALNDFYQVVKAVGAGQDNGCPVSASAKPPAQWSP